MRIFVKPFVRTATDKTITLDVEAFETFDSVKAKIQEKEDFPSGEQRLLFLDIFQQEYTLLNWYTFLDYNVPQDSTLMVVLCFEISVTTLTGKTMTLDVETAQFVEYIKAKIEHEVSIPSSQFDLVFGATQLEEGYTLSQYDIQANSILTLVRRGGRKRRGEESAEEVKLLDGN